MALLVLRAIFVMVSVGIAVLIFNSPAVQASPTWVPWAILAGMVALPLTVIGFDGMIRRKELTTITAIYFGLLIGVFLTYVTMLALQPIMPLSQNDPLHSWLPLIVGSVLCYLCTSLLMQTRDDFRFLIPYVEFARDVRGLRPNVLDASTIVDGRIADLAEAGVFESRFVVPSFVLDELQAAAESNDRQKKMRGRRGLDVLARLRENDAIDIDVIAPRQDSHDELSTETRVVDLARELGGRVITTDPSAAKLAGVRTVPAINVNDVAAALKPSFVPGDPVSVRLVKQGEEPDQAVGYLEDGTMVVVENGRDQIGRTVRASVTSTLQTSAGRLVFAPGVAARGAGRAVSVTPPTMASSRRSVCTSSLILALAWTWHGFVAAEDHPGVAIYREHCLRCHGESGAGTLHAPDPLIGDRSVNQLAAHIDATMPEDDPSKVTGEAARQVAAYIHAAFYSAVARDRHRPARIELSRLTVRQHRNVLADLVGGFRAEAPAIGAARGLTGEYFKTRGFKRDKGLVLERVDPTVDFDFGTRGPVPATIAPARFSIRWTGALMPTETGVHEFVLRTEQAAKLTLNGGAGGPALIDAAVKSGSDTEYRGAIFLLGGRAYPVTLEFWKARQGVEDDDQDAEKAGPASIRMLWRPPHGVLETVPNRVLIPHDAPRVFTPATPFPPDDRSIGYERGTSVSEEWLSSATAVAIETADHVLADLDQLARVPRDAPDREASLRMFATAFAERAFRRPLTDDLRSLVVDRPFAGASDLDTGLRRSLLTVLGSPRFLFREAGTNDAFATAARLSFGLWDSLPDDPLWQAAARGELETTEQIRGQAERMALDRRTRAKVRDFLFSWLRVDLGPELAKDPARHPEFTPDVAADLRTSLELFLDDAVWVGGDFRRLFTADDLPLNGRLAPLYGAAVPADAGFTSVRLDDGRRGGVLSHPYLMSVLSYPASTSPIHRGVFLARSVLGNTLRPPQQAVAPLPAEQHPDLTTRERVSLQTSAVTCQTCHTLINPLGFALEEFDEIGRYRSGEPAADGERPIDASGSYQPRTGQPATFRGGRELGAYVARSHDAQEAFVQALFHALVKQPVRAWGVDTLDRLTTAFAASEFDIRRLLVDIMEVAAVPPQRDVASTPAPELTP